MHVLTLLFDTSVIGKPRQKEIRMAVIAASGKPHGYRICFELGTLKKKENLRPCLICGRRFSYTVKGQNVFYP